MRPLPPAERFETNVVHLPTEEGISTEVLFTYIPKVGADASTLRDMIRAEGAVDMRIPVEDIDMLCASLQEAKERAQGTSEPPSSLASERTTDV